MRDNLSNGALVGAALALPLVAVSYLGWKLFDLPFAPFDVFDWAVRALPGSIATLGIDAMVRATGALPFGTAAAAKIAEQTMALALVIGLGALVGAVVFASLSAAREPASLLGVVLGAVLGGLVVLIEQDLNRLASPAFASGAWVFMTMFSWGAACGWICDSTRLVGGSDGHVDRVPALDRRWFLRRFGGALAAVSAVSTLVGALAGRRHATVAGDRWSASHALPNAGASVVPVPGTRAEFTPVERHYRIDAVTRPPAISGDRWRLRIGGLVERPLQLTLDDVRRHEPMHQFVTLACISNPVGGDLISTTRWTGISVQALLQEWRLRPSASHLKITSADGFSEVVALETIAADPRVMLTYAWDGMPLPVDHGFPLRLYVPDLYGMKLPKWVDRIDALDHWEPGYWVERGWDREGRMRSAAAIDTMAVGVRASGVRQASQASLGGIAHAGARGISKVELQVDGGQWQYADLRDPLSDTTWVVWRADLSLDSGDHTVAARCYERDGQPQTRAPHSKRVRV